MIGIYEDSEYNNRYSLVFPLTDNSILLMDSRRYETFMLSFARFIQISKAYNINITLWILT